MVYFDNSAGQPDITVIGTTEPLAGWKHELNISLSTSDRLVYDVDFAGNGQYFNYGYCFNWTGSVLQIELENASFDDDNTTP